MTDDDDTQATAPAGSQRLDKWLWFVRVVKTRSLAQRLVTAGAVRVNKIRVDKTAHSLKPGDVVTVALDRRVRVLEVRAPGERRGSPQAAQRLYVDLTPPPEPKVADTSLADPAHPMAASGRPNKRNRRLLQELKRR